MKNRCRFIENEHLYNFVISTMYFNEAKREKEIFELWRKGYNNCDIAKGLLPRFNSSRYSKTSRIY